jgi:hypothetical protein
MSNLWREKPKFIIGRYFFHFDIFIPQLENTLSLMFPFLFSGCRSNLTTIEHVRKLNPPDIPRLFEE